MGSSIAVHLAGLAPVPVGHEVEVRTYRVERGFFAKKSVVPEHQPLVIDRDTGIVYGEDWHFQEINVYSSGEARPDLPLEPRRDLQENTRWTGKVTVCRIAWIGSGDSRYPQTTLLVEPTKSGAP